MPATSLQDLAEQFCALIGEQPPTLNAGEDGVLAFSATMREVEFDVKHHPSAQPDQIAIDFYFGQVPEDRELPILRELLNLNHQMRLPAAPAFSRDPQTGEVVLHYMRAMADTGGEELLAGIEILVDTVLQWRHDFFMERGEDTPFDALMAGGLSHLA